MKRHTIIIFFSLLAIFGCKKDPIPLNEYPEILNTTISTNDNNISVGQSCVITVKVENTSDENITFDTYAEITIDGPLDTYISKHFNINKLYDSSPYETMATIQMDGNGNFQKDINLNKLVWTLLDYSTEYQFDSIVPNNNYDVQLILKIFDPAKPNPYIEESNILKLNISN